jgi:hypothetical protein
MQKQNSRVRRITSRRSLLTTTPKRQFQNHPRVLYPQWPGLLEACQICSHSGTTPIMFLCQQRKECLVRSPPPLDLNLLTVLRYQAGPPPPPSPLNHRTIPGGEPPLLINPTISRDTTQIEQAGTQANLSGLVTGLDGSHIELSLARSFSTGSRSPSIRSLPLERDLESNVDFNGEIADSDRDVGSDGDLSEHSSVFTDDSDGSETSSRQYKWRKRLQAQKQSSLSRNQHTSAGTAPRLIETASSLPDLELYKTWDPRPTLKVSTEVHINSLL